MTNQEIFDLVACFDRSTAQTMKLSTQEFTIELTRGGAAAPAAAAPGAVPAAVSAPAPAPQAAAGPLHRRAPGGHFYAAPSPDQAPFVLPGGPGIQGADGLPDRGHEDMSEVPAPCDCVIETVCKSDGELVSFGEPLFRYKPC